jgi:hypothetical protein
MGLFSILITITMTMAIGTSRAVSATQAFTSLNEQARVAIERMSRELRQAEAITAVTLPTATTGVAMTLTNDFNSNGIIDSSAVDPEVLTYRYDPVGHRVTLTANDVDGTAVTRPILSENVTKFSLQFRSSLWQYDKNGDGVTAWQELDASPSIGNGNGILDGAELSRIDSVAIELTVTEDGHSQTYQTAVGLRNNALS